MAASRVRRCWECTAPKANGSSSQHGVDPDIVVDNLPHATFSGGDAQLAVGVAELLKEIEREPLAAPKPPPYPRIR